MLQVKEIAFSVNIDFVSKNKFTIQDHIERLGHVAEGHSKSNLRTFSILDLNSDCFAMNFECQMLASTFDGFCFLWTALHVLWSQYQVISILHSAVNASCMSPANCSISDCGGIFVRTLSSVKFNRPSFCSLSSLSLLIWGTDFSSEMTIDKCQMHNEHKHKSIT